ncbi:formimidoylglutamase [Virgibacillus ainsalahensis]
MYKQSEKQNWTGRVDSDTDKSSFRLHQVVNLKPIYSLEETENAFCLVGFESDEGVLRNKGRAGAAQAPNMIRSFLSNLPSTILNNLPLFDTGNIACEGKKMEQAQEELGKHVDLLLSHSTIPIIIGGGHETLYGHYLGARKYIGNDASLGIINIDAHFDMRQEETPSSGTMFRQIVIADKNADYLCLGIQPFGNTKSLFQEAERLGCTYFLEENVVGRQSDQVLEAIDGFSSKHDAIILTLCTDSIAASDAPGVSAPTPFGLEPKVVRKLLRYIVSKKNILSFDISEVNPLLDENNKTTRLAAYLIAEVIENFNWKRIK